MRGPDHHSCLPTWNWRIPFWTSQGLPIKRQCATETSRMRERRTIRSQTWLLASASQIQNCWQSWSDSKPSECGSRKWTAKIQGSPRCLPLSAFFQALWNSAVFDKHIELIQSLVIFLHRVPIFRTGVSDSQCSVRSRDAGRNIGGDSFEFRVCVFVCRAGAIHFVSQDARNFCA